MAKTISNQDIIWEFTKAKAVLEVIDKKPFRVRAYQNAIDTISNLDQELASLAKTSDLSDLPGIGKELAEKIHDLLDKGRSEGLDKLYVQVPAGMFELIKIPGIGAKKAYRLATEFALTDPKTALKQLKKAAETDQISRLDGFGAKSQQDILNNIAQSKPKATRLRLDKADAIANQIIDYLQGCSQARSISALGSIRRRSETVGDIDIGLITDQPDEVVKYIKKFDQVSSVSATGENIIRIRLLSGHQVDIKFSPAEKYGAMLQHFTGSRAHNIQLRKLALKSDLSLSEHGVKIKGEKKSIEEEKEIYSILNLQFIPPELRQNGEEIKIAQQNKLPKLLTIDDIKGETHTHTDYNWRSSHDYGEKMSTLLDQAHANKLDWIVIGDHQPAKSEYENKSYSEIVTQRQTWIDQQLSQWKKSVKNSKLHIFSNLEVDIDKTGNVLIDEEAANRLDFVTASIHSSFTLDTKAQTQRLLKTIQHPRVKIIAHPTGRLINQRAGIQADWEVIFKACTKHNVALEINANPKRLDLPDSMVKQAKEYKVKFAIGTDAHVANHLNFLSYGVDVARRGWLTKDDIINTFTHSQLSQWLKQEK